MQSNILIVWYPNVKLNHTITKQVNVIKLEMMLCYFIIGLALPFRHWIWMHAYDCSQIITNQGTDNCDGNALIWSNWKGYIHFWQTSKKYSIFNHINFLNIKKYKNGGRGRDSIVEICLALSHSHEFWQECYGSYCHGQSTSRPWLEMILLW